MRAYYRLTSEPIDYVVTEEGKFEVVFQDETCKTYSNSSFQSLFRLKLEPSPTQKETPEVQVKKPCFYEHALSLVGKQIKASGRIKFPFPEDLASFAIQIATDFESSSEFPSDPATLKKLRNKFKIKYRDQLTNAKISYAYSLQQDEEPHVIAGHELWAKDHLLRACVAYVEVMAIDKALAMTKAAVVAKAEEVAEVDPFTCKIPVEEMAKYDPVIAKRLRTDKDFFNATIEAKKAREIAERIKGGLTDVE